MSVTIETIAKTVSLRLSVFRRNYCDSSKYAPTVCIVRRYTCHLYASKDYYIVITIIVVVLCHYKNTENLPKTSSAPYKWGTSYITCIVSRLVLMNFTMRIHNILYYGEESTKKKL